MRRALGESPAQGAYRRPAQIGCARLVIGSGAASFRPKRATLDLHRAEITVQTSVGMLRIRQAAEDEVFWIEGPEEWLRTVPIALHPVWDFLGEALAHDGCRPPERWGDVDGGGFEQTLPEDEPVALAWERRRGHIVAATALGFGAGGAARRRLADADPARLARLARRWWRQYWRDVPSIEIPDPVIEEAWAYGLYRQAGLTPPHAPPAGLQGPWMEDHKFPPWSNDYHFNINVQLIYEPALATNRADHFMPMWRMLMGWLPEMRANARTFFGVEDALMLPHAVDDRCHVVGHFWRGTLDQACIAWMALLAWRHYRHTGEMGILREIAWPLLNGAFHGFYAMLERIETPAGPRWSLPVSVSAEYPGWGRDASFQLAAIHALTQVLPQAARRLGEPEDARWASVERELPPYTTIPFGPQGTRRRIALWEGQDLVESHRHHSHLAAMTPFRTVDPFDSVHRAVVAESLRHWVRTGAGLWSGWCLPWASMIASRCNLADAAVAWLHWWRNGFVNAGRAPLHDAAFPGISDIGSPDPIETPAEDHPHEIMQCDAAMGAISAIAELLVQVRGDTLWVTPALPATWRDFSFDGVRVEGGFRVGATIEGGYVREIRLQNDRDAVARLAWGRRRLAGEAGGRSSPITEVSVKAGELNAIATGD